MSETLEQIELKYYKEQLEECQAIIKQLTNYHPLEGRPFIYIPTMFAKCYQLILLRTQRLIFTLIKMNLLLKGMDLEMLSISNLFIFRPVLRISSKGI